MLRNSSTIHQPNLFGTDLLMQLDPGDPLLKLASAIPWQEFEESFSIHYTAATGAPSKPIRLMVGLLVLKQLENLSDEAVVLQWKRNPYYQAFCGMKEFQQKLPCHSTELVHFRKRIGAEGVERIFRMSVGLHGRAALEDTVHIDTTVQEKNITYPTDSKLAIRIINRLNKVGKAHGLSQRRTFVKEVRSLRLAIRHFRHVTKRAKAKRALKRLRTIAGILIRELRRELPQHCLFERYQQDFLLYERVLARQPDLDDLIARNGIYNGWDRIAVDNNKQKAMMASPEWTDENDEENYVVFNYMIGNERYDGHTKADETDTRGRTPRHTFDLYGQWHMAKPFTMRLWTFSGFEYRDRTLDGWLGLSLFAKVDATDWFSIAGRGDFVHVRADSENLFFDDDKKTSDMGSGTLTLSFQPHSNIILRLEGRYDAASFPLFYKGKVALADPMDPRSFMVNARSQTTILAGMTTFF